MIRILLQGMKNPSPHATDLLLGLVHELNRFPKLEPVIIERTQVLLLLDQIAELSIAPVAARRMCTVLAAEYRATLAAVVNLTEDEAMTDAPTDEYSSIDTFCGRVSGPDIPDQVCSAQDPESPRR